MFHELRPDVFPVDDLGLRRRSSPHYGGGAPLTLDEIRAARRALAPVAQRGDVVPVALARSDSGRVLSLRG